MICEPDATHANPAPQDNQLMSKHRVLSFTPQLRLEWRGQDGQNETEQPHHSASLGDFFRYNSDKVFGTHRPTLWACGALHRFHTTVDDPKKMVCEQNNFIASSESSRFTSR